MSWLISQALMEDYANSRSSLGLVEEYSGESCLGGEPSALLNVMPTPHKFWHSGKTMDALSLSRFGLTCAVLTEDLGRELLTWFLAASRARTSAAPARAKDSTANALDFGEKWPGSFAMFDRDSFSWRTRQCSLFEDLEPCLETWPRWGLMHGGECWELPPLAHPTDANESGLLPTLTLISCEHPGRFKLKEGQQTCISMELAKRDKWAVGGKYSPSHAAWFMAWPEWWTSLGHSAMDKYRLWRQRHGGF